MDEVTVHVDAPADKLYSLVTDVRSMGRWSPECTGARWLAKASGPAVGARFVGFNRKGLVHWFTRCEVTAAEPGHHYEFEVRESGMVWGYRFVPSPGGGGTDVTEYRSEARRPGVVVRAVQRSGLIGRDRDTLMVNGMRATLERVKAAAEA